MCCRVLLAAKVQDYGVWLCCMPLSPEPSESLHGSKRAGGVLPDHAFHTTDDSEGHDFSIEDRERCNIEEIKRERKEIKHVVWSVWCSQRYVTGWLHVRIPAIASPVPVDSY